MRWSEGCVCASAKGRSVCDVRGDTPLKREAGPCDVVQSGRGVAVIHLCCQ